MLEMVVYGCMTRRKEASYQGCLGHDMCTRDVRGAVRRELALRISGISNNTVRSANVRLSSNYNLQVIPELKTSLPS